MHSNFLKTLAITLAISVLGTLWCSPPVIEASELNSTIPWGGDLDIALRQASQTGQPVLVHFYSDNCVPCKMLDAKAFRNHALGAAMTRSIHPVKINCDQHRDIALRYEITRFPTDLFLHHSGEELYRTVSPQDPADYIKLLDRVAMKNRDFSAPRMTNLAQRNLGGRSSKNSFDTASAKDGQPVSSQSQLFLAASTGKHVEPQVNQFCLSDQSTESTQAEMISTANDSVFQLASHSSESRENRYQRSVFSAASNPSAMSTPTAPSTPSDNGRSVLADPSSANASESMASVSMGGVFSEDNTPGLDGFCPVALVEKKSWVQGKGSFSVRHRGRVYQCESEEARDRFLLAPDRYSPVLSGYDIVHFLETNQLVPGKREFGCEFQGRVFVFMNATNKAHFDVHAIQYAQSLGATHDAERVANGTSGSAIQR
ncbi:MAG: thioredoxin family protein [Pirellulaceae bacterium]|nr:thioredoxin family protein [Pirellulaceae bacterium]